MSPPRQDAVAGLYLAFTVLGVDYALPVERVREAVPAAAVTWLAGGPATLRGLVEVRGTLLPVLDLGARRGRREPGAAREACVLVVESSSEGQPLTLGLLADAVAEVVSLGPDEVTPPPPGPTGGCVESAGRTARGPLLLLDVDCVVAASDAELAERARARRRGAAGWLH